MTLRCCDPGVRLPLRQPLAPSAARTLKAPREASDTTPHGCGQGGETLPSKATGHRRRCHSRLARQVSLPSRSREAGRPLLCDGNAQPSCSLLPEVGPRTLLPRVPARGRCQGAGAETGPLSRAWNGLPSSVPPSAHHPPARAPGRPRQEPGSPVPGPDRTPTDNTFLTQREDIGSRPLIRLRAAGPREDAGPLAAGGPCAGHSCPSAALGPESSGNRELPAGGEHVARGLWSPAARNTVAPVRRPAQRQARGRAAEVLAVVSVPAFAS